MVNRKFGAIPSPPDERDYQLKDLISGVSILPCEYVNPLITSIPIIDQGASNECVPCSIVYLRWLTEYEQSGNTEVFSPNYLYANRPEDGYKGEGAVPREILSTLIKHGVCYYNDFPGFYSYIDAVEAYNRIKNTADELAYPWRVSSYYAVSTVNNIKTAVYNLGGVSAMFPVYDALMQPDENGVIHYNPNDNNTYGNHQMTIVGWTEDCWIVLNSWGSN